MRFLIVTHVLHKVCDGQMGGYGPYVREMNLWLKHVDSARLVAPVESGVLGAIDLTFDRSDLEVSRVPAFDLTTPRNAIKAMAVLPLVLMRLLQAMRWAEHIHIRCPGNMGLLGCLLQVFFPGKPKSVKFAGNWDPTLAQPTSYRIQRWILNNAFLTRNARVMVYGSWPKSSRNLIGSFTATYTEAQFIEPAAARKLDGLIRLLFVGSLTNGKQPFVAVDSVAHMRRLGLEVRLDIYGEGRERAALESYIQRAELEKWITIHGGVTSEDLIKVYRQSHFLIFPSRSEGWPKVVAEAMAWGCVPITTRVSCVPEMLGNGARGALVNARGIEIALAVQSYVGSPDRYRGTALAASEWSRQYTIERFEREIMGIVQGRPLGE